MQKNNLNKIYSFSYDLINNKYVNKYERKID